MRVDRWNSGPDARHAHHVLGAPAADVDHQRGPARRITPRRGAAEGQARLLVAADRAHVEAVALAHLRQELVAVGRVAHGAGGHRDAALGAVLLREVAIGVEAGQDALDGVAGEPARRVDPLAQPRDVGPAIDLLELVVARVVRHEQTGRVGPEVRDGYPPSMAHRRWNRSSRPGCELGGRACGAVAALERAQDRCYIDASDAGWSSQVARRAHNPKVAGSNPAPAIHERPAQAGLSAAGPDADWRRGTKEVPRANLVR